MVVAGLLNGLANDVTHLDVGVSRDLTDDKGQASGDGGLTGDPTQRVPGHDGVEDRVRNLIGDLVGMAFGNRLRGKEMRAAVHRVPDSQPLRYCSCSGVKVSIPTFIAANFSRAISRSIPSGTG